MDNASLSDYGGRMVMTDGHQPTVEMVDPNDNGRARQQYRRTSDGGVEKRRLRSDGSLFRDGSPWRRLSRGDMFAMSAARGDYHPVLDSLSLCGGGPAPA